MRGLRTILFPQEARIVGSKRTPAPPGLFAQRSRAHSRRGAASPPLGQLDALVQCPKMGRLTGTFGKAGSRLFSSIKLQYSSDS
eukprot:2881675-Prymnesium_polylepis.1